jgi:outer membrane protein assembly factor BamB
MRSRWGMVVAVALAAAVSECWAQAPGWTRFRGPNGAGVSEVRFPATWTDDDYVWKATLPGEGHSSPVAWDGRLFLVSGNEQDGTRYVVCLDAVTGRQLWVRQYASQPHRKHSLNSFASSTPAVDAQGVYVCWATPSEYVVLALDHAGQQRWRVDLGPFKAGHGFGVSPIVHGSLLIVPGDQDGDSFLAALRTADGSIAWKVPRDSQVTYSTPCIYRHADGSEVLVFTNWNYGVQGLDPATGRTRWQIQPFGKKEIETAIGSPIVAGDLIVATCGWLTRQTHLVAIRPPESGTGAATEVYRLQRAAPLTTTPLATRDLLIAWADEGIVTCLDARSGQLHWSRRVGGTYYGSPVAAGDKIYCISKDGEVVVLAADAQFQVLGRNDLGEPSNSTPAVIDGRMYLRTLRQVMALRAERAP